MSIKKEKTDQKENKLLLLIKYIKRRPFVSATWFMAIGTWITSLISILALIFTISYNRELNKQNIKMYEHEKESFKVKYQLEMESLELKYRPNLITESVDINFQEDLSQDKFSWIIWAIKNNSDNIAKDMTAFLRIIFVERKYNIGPIPKKENLAETVVPDDVLMFLSGYVNYNLTNSDRIDINDIIKRLQDNNTLVLPLQLPGWYFEFNEKEKNLSSQNSLTFLVYELNGQEKTLLEKPGILTNTVIDKIKKRHGFLYGIFTIAYKSDIGYYKYLKNYIGRLDSPTEKFLLNEWQIVRIPTK